MTRFVTAYRRAAVALTLGLLAGAAAAQVVLFDAPDLQGARLTIRADEPNLAESDFNDRVASVSVRSGLWELCVEAGYRGDCLRLAPGDYRNLDARFTRTLTSLRAVVVQKAGEGAAAGPVIVYPDGSIAQPSNRPPTVPGAVVVLPPPPSACNVGATEACPGCSITCSGGRQAWCKQGSDYAKLIDKPAECAWQARCECR